MRAGQFHVYAVRHVDEALSLLVGEDAGTPDDKGSFPKGSINARVVERLREIAEIGMGEEDKPEQAKEALTAALPAKTPKKPREKKPPVE